MITFIFEHTENNKEHETYDFVLLVVTAGTYRLRLHDPETVGILQRLEGGNLVIFIRTQEHQNRINKVSKK